jgi:transcriptional regulator with XRE-family HTH domain
MTVGESAPEDGYAVVISLSDRLKNEREVRGITQSQAARELDVARTAYRLWEMEAARPSPDRWRLLARWLGVSMSTLLLAEGLMTEDEHLASEVASGRYEAKTGLTSDDASASESGDFFKQAQSMIDKSIEQGVVSAEEAGHLREMFERIQRGARSDSDP